ncbi:MAG: macro domain-containing protein [Exilibacterium sp.]
MKIIYAAIACIFLQACSTVGSVDRPPGYFQEGSSSSQEGLVESVTFGDDDKKIDELLHYQVKLPEKNRIAILKLSTDNYWRFYSNDFTQLNDSHVHALITKLRGSNRVYDASFLPAMLVPEKRTVPVLREAAARFQADLFYAWKKYFDNIDSFEVIDGDILKEEGDAIISPANSFGYMDGGLDLKYSKHFGWELESKVRAVLEQKYYGEIPVGNAIIVETALNDLPFLISAPTMRVPSNVSNTVNAYLAFKAIIQACLEHNKTNYQKIKTVLCPGLATGEGKMPVEKCANQMYMAYQVVLGGQMLQKGGLAAAVINHMELLGTKNT